MKLALIAFGLVAAWLLLRRRKPEPLLWDGDRWAYLWRDSEPVEVV